MHRQRTHLPDSRLITNEGTQTPVNVKQCVCVWLLIILSLRGKQTEKTRVWSYVSTGVKISDIVFLACMFTGGKINDFVFLSCMLTGWKKARNLHSGTQTLTDITWLEMSENVKQVFALFSAHTYFLSSPVFFADVAHRDLSPGAIPVPKFWKLSSKRLL